MKPLRASPQITGLAALGLACAATAQGWTDEAIAPVTNPIFFESALIQSEVRPLFMWHRLDEDFLGTEADVRLYAVQLRWAVTDRLAIIATKDGYIEIEPDAGSNSDGWANIAAGVKYAAYQDDASQFVVTPGFTFEIPIGSDEVFQGEGDGIFNLFVSAIKGWDRLHLNANLGGQIPMDADANTANLRYSVMLDYFASRWFIPFVAFNAFTTLSDGDRLPLSSEGFDLINFGSMDASGTTQGAIGVGFRTRLLPSLDFGFAYENGVLEDDDIFKDRFTFDMVWRF
ncbi:MAG: hypothetical protein ACKVYV_17915 [Limisphaerales bacterium]